MPWTFPILTAILERLRPTPPPEGEAGPPRPPITGAAAPTVGDLEALQGQSAENYGTYEGPRTRKLYNIFYWPVWESYSVHVTEGDQEEWYRALAMWFDTLEDAQEAIRRYL